jgi:Arc/MetJ family transcription regulator
MRTTLTLDDDVLRLIQDAVHRERRSMKEVVNDALRASLREPRSTEFVARVHHAVLRPGVDSGRLNALVDELADDAAIAAMRQR